MSNNDVKYPEWAVTPKEKILFRFLSNLSDHFGKSLFWLKSQHSLYCTKYERFDIGFLKENLHYYLMNDMHAFLPTLPQITEYLRNRPAFQERWERRDYTNGKKFCNDCRTDADGTEGGFRQVYLWDKDKDKEIEYMATCTCDAGKCMKGIPYTTLVSNLGHLHKNSEIYYSYRNHRHYLVSAKEQSEKKWADRVKAGRCTLSSMGEYIPNLKHPIYKTFIGIQICADEGWELPEEYLQGAKNDKAHQNAIKYYRHKRLLAKGIATDGQPMYITPKSMAEALTGTIMPTVDKAIITPPSNYVFDFEDMQGDFTEEIDSE